MERRYLQENSCAFAPLFLHCPTMIAYRTHRVILKPNCSHSNKTARIHKTQFEFLSNYYVFSQDAKHEIPNRRWQTKTCDGIVQVREHNLFYYHKNEVYTW